MLAGEIYETAEMPQIPWQTQRALDGGTSAHLLVREASGEARSWRGFRRVPVGLVVEPRTPT